MNSLHAVSRLGRGSNVVGDYTCTTYVPYFGQFEPAHNMSNFRFLPPIMHSFLCFKVAHVFLHGVPGTGFHSRLGLRVQVKYRVRVGITVRVQVTSQLESFCAPSRNISIPEPSVVR